MHHVVTLAAGSGRTLSTDRLSVGEEALAEHHIEPGGGDWLAAGRACDLPIGPVGRPERLSALSDDLRRRLEGAEVDVAVQPAAGRRKRLLVADMDSTIVTGETLDELADEAGIKPHVAAITARAMNGELDFKAALRERVRLLANLPVAALERTWARVEPTAGAATLVRTMRANGAFALLVSGGFRFFTSRVRTTIGFDRDEANDLEIADGRLTGKVHEPILDRDSKLRFLLAAAAERGLTSQDCLAIGDGANDLPMLQEAGLGIAFRAKPTVAAACPVRIDHGDLETALFYQGYRESEFVG